MRQLTDGQMEFLAYLNSPEVIERDRKAQEVMAAEREKRERSWEAYKVQKAEEQRKDDEALRPLREALAAAGIKLACGGFYEGSWIEYQIGNGPVVEVEDGLDTFEED